MKAIETVYKGYRFRSRLEARWAVFLDHMKEPWEYEKEGYELPSGWYLPDFWLPWQQTWLEIKPNELSELEMKKCIELATITKKDVIAAVGLPKIPKSMELKEVIYKDELIGDYLKAHEHMLNGRNYGRSDKMPFVHKEYVGFFPEHFKDWTSSKQGNLTEKELEDYIDTITMAYNDDNTCKVAMPDIYPEDYWGKLKNENTELIPYTTVLSRDVAIPEYKFTDTNMYFYEEGTLLPGSKIYLNKINNKLSFDFAETFPMIVRLTEKDIQVATMARFEFGESGHAYK